MRSIAATWHHFAFLGLLAGSLIGQESLGPNKLVKGICRPSHPSVEKIWLPSGSATRIVVEQLSEDVQVTVESPGGAVRVVDQFDFSAEEFTILANQSGIYRLLISPVKSNVRSAQFSIRVSPIHDLTNRDRSRFAAEDLATSAKQLARNRARWMEARDRMSQSIAAWDHLGEEFDVARTHLKAGDLLHSRSLEEEARAEYRAAKRICETLGDLRCVAEALNNSALTSLSLADIPAAQAEFTTAIDAWRRLHLPLAEASSHLNWGLALWTSNSYSQALGQEQLARRAFRHGKPVSLARTLNNIGVIYLSMSEYRHASWYFSEALRVSRGQPDSDAVRARIRINLGRALFLPNCTPLALREERIAVVEMQRLGDKGGLSEALNNRGQAELRCGRLKAAKASLLEALDLYRELKNRRGTASALHYLGILALDGKDLDQARKFLEEALQIRKDALLDDASESLFELARIEQMSRHQSASFRRIEEAIAIAETLRSRVLGEKLRRSFLSAKRKYFDFYISAMLSNPAQPEWDRKIEQSFETSERYLAMALVDLLGADRLAAKSASPDDLRRLHSVHRQLNALSYRLAAASDADYRAFGPQWHAQMEQLLLDETELENLIRTQNSKYEEAVAPPIASLQEIQRMLHSGDILVKYFLGSARSYVWIVYPDRVHVAELPRSSVIRSQVQSYVGLLSAARERATDRHKKAAWNAVGERLLDSLGLTFEQMPERVIIIPDGVLHGLPFAALRLRLTGHRGAGGPLGLACEIVQAPSASVFRVLEQRRQAIAAAPLTAAVFADPVFDNLDSRVKKEPLSSNADRMLAGIPLQRLSYSQVVANTAEKLLPKDRRYIALGFDANRTHLFDEKAGHAKFLFLLTHALVSDRFPSQASNLVLSMVDRRGRHVDGLVSLEDISDLKLASSVVLVLACNAAEPAGESSTVSLSSGFLVAGAAGVVASPLRVEAEPTSYFVSEFLKALVESEGITPSAALLKARRACARGKWADPFFWGSFALTSGLS